MEYTGRSRSEGEGYWIDSISVLKIRVNEIFNDTWMNLNSENGTLALFIKSPNFLGIMGATSGLGCSNPQLA